MAKIRWFFCLISLLHPLLSFAEPNNITSHPNWKLLNPDGCGISSSDRIVGGIDAAMGAYPWLARIGYVPQNTTGKAPGYNCGGAVINKFYIITAAHCSVNLRKNMVPVIVRLGEHNTKTNPDCEGSFCNDPYKEYAVAEIIGHEKWDSSKLKNDVALLRVKEEIQFTDFVRPICMITEKLLEKDFVGQIAEVAGWGYTNSSVRRHSEVLQALKVKIRHTSTCLRHKSFKKFSIDSRQICAGGVKGHDSCGGDSGGPLMKIEVGEEAGSPRYFIIGLVSFGLTACGHDSTPSIYTNVSKYLLWILDHLRP